MQSRWASAAEAVANVVTGYGVSAVLNVWLFGVTWSQSARLSVWYVLASLIRSYVLRRVFARWGGGRQFPRVTLWNLLAGGRLHPPSRNAHR